MFRNDDHINYNFLFRYFCIYYIYYIRFFLFVPFVRTIENPSDYCSIHHLFHISHRHCDRNCDCHFHQRHDCHGNTIVIAIVINTVVTILIGNMIAIVIMIAFFFFFFFCQNNTFVVSIIVVAGDADIGHVLVLVLLLSTIPIMFNLFFIVLDYNRIFYIRRDNNTSVILFVTNNEDIAAGRAIKLNMCYQFICWRCWCYVSSLLLLLLPVLVLILL